MMAGNVYLNRYLWNSRLCVLPEEIEHKYHDKQDILKKDAQGRFLLL